MAAEQTISLTSPELDGFVASASPEAMKAARVAWRTRLAAEVARLKKLSAQQYAEKVAAFGLDPTDVIKDQLTTELKARIVGQVHAHNGRWERFQSHLANVKAVYAERLEAAMADPTKLISLDAETYELTTGEGALLVCADNCKYVIDQLEDVQRIADLLRTWRDKPATAYNPSAYQKVPPGNKKGHKGRSNGAQSSGASN